MWGTTAAMIALVVVCLLLQGFFSGSEMALVSANRHLLQSRADKGHTGARLALRLLEREEQLLGTCLVGTNLCVITGATLVGTLLRWHGVEQGLVVAAVFTPVALILGETYPKTLFQARATVLAPWLSWPLRFAQIVFAPALVMISVWGRMLSRLTGQTERRPVTREELLGLLNRPERASDIDEDEREMIHGIFAIGEVPVESVMTPLVSVDLVDASVTVAQASDVALRHGYSRIPVFRERVDNIVGQVHAIDLLFANDPEDGIENLLAPVTFVPETLSAQDLLHQMRLERVHLVVVVDEYGGSIGIVTVEDLLEEVVGEIRDERDPEDPKVLRIGPGEWRVPGRIELDELNTALNRELPEGDYETLAGLLLATVGRIPSAGDVIRVGELTCHVEEATDRAIVTVRLVAKRRIS